jgi:hypothetical protein
MPFRNFWRWFFPRPTPPPAEPTLFSIADADVTPSDKLGMAFPWTPNTYSELAENGFGIVRIAASWDLTQPNATTWNWAGLDDRIQAIMDSGMKPFLTFASDADWATLPGDNDSKNKMPRDLAEWETFVGAVAERYAGMVPYYQFANEFAGIDNRSGGWSSTKEDLVTYVNAGYAAVKAKDPNALVFMGGVASTNLDLLLVNSGVVDGDVVQALSETTEMRFTEAEARSPEMDALIADRFEYPLSEVMVDGYSAHLYGDRRRDGLRIDAVKNATAQGFLISTESGAPTWTGTEPTDRQYFTEALMSTLNALAEGCEVVFWFHDYPTGETFYNQHVPLRDSEGNPKPNLWGLKLLARYLGPGSNVIKVDEGVLYIQDSTQITVFGEWSDLANRSELENLTNPDYWVLHDPAAGTLRKLDTGVLPESDDFVVIET